MDKQEIKQNIIEACKELLINGIDNIDIYIGGSSTISLLTNFPRKTMDIDIVSSLKTPEIRNILARFEIEDNLATSVEPSLRELYGYYETTSDFFHQISNIRFFVVWPEVVLLGKAFSDDRDKDREDVKRMIGNLDDARLDKACKSLLKYRTKDSPFDLLANEIIAARDLLKGK